MNSAELKAFMGWFKWVLMGISILIVIALFVISYFYHKKKNLNPVKFMTVTGIFGAISVILYVIIPDFGLGFTPFWLKVHLDEIPMLLAGFMYGPVAAIMVDLIKTLVKLPLTSTACVGEIGDFFFSIVFVIPAVIFYQRKRDFTSALIGLGISVVLHVVFAMIMNVYFMIPFYSMFYNISLQSLEKACSAIFPFIKGDNWVWLYALTMVAPMNFVKDGIVIIVVLLVYKRLRILINSIGNNSKKTAED